MDLQGFLFPDSPWKWQFATADYKVASLQQLLQKFEDEYNYDEKPLAFARDPVNKEGRPYYATTTNWIVLPYRRGFYFTIERNGMFGPHACRLYYKSWQADGEIAWVAICQVSAMWHSDERMLAAFTEAINSDELYQSPKTAATIVIL